MTKKRPGKNRSQADSMSLATWHYTHDPDFHLVPININPNHKFINKPHGALWVSPCDTQSSWAKWCHDNNYPLGHYRYRFTIDLTNIVTISDRADCDKLPWLNLDSQYFFEWFVADYPALKKSGVDAVWLTDDGVWKLPRFPPIFYGWDCESLAIINERCITQIWLDPDFRGPYPPPEDWERPVYAAENEWCADPSSSPE